MISFRVLLINCSFYVTMNELIAKIPWDLMMCVYRCAMDVMYVMDDLLPKNEKTLGH